MLQGLLDGVAALVSRLKKSRAINVNDRPARDAVITTARGYFDEVRPLLVDRLGETDRLVAHDRRWQDLIRLAHGNNQRRRYLRILAAIRNDLREFSVDDLSRGVRVSGAGPESSITDQEQLLADTLESLVPTAAASYRQGLQDLADSRRRISYRGTASEFREVVRETLDYLAPDTEVMTQPGFKIEPGLSGPTMKQKVRYVFRSRGRSSSRSTTTENAVVAVDGIVGDLFRATYTRASTATHAETTRGEVLRIKQYIDTVLFDLLELHGS
jgi:hypothetical protein